MKRAAIYARVSTGKQAAGELSLPDQKRQCEKFAEAKGYEVAAEFIDAGVSARTDKRPEFQRMINLACAPHRPFDAILVHSQSRFARNTRDLLVYKEKLEANGVQILSITQESRATPALPSVQSRHVQHRVEFESFRLIRPAFADVLVAKASLSVFERPAKL